MINGMKTIVKIAAIIAFLATPLFSHAATMRLSPASGVFQVGETFSVSILLDTDGKSINALHAHLSFPADKLQVVSPSVGKSIIAVWTSAPNYDNREGVIHLEGGIPQGLNAQSGIITTVTFRTKQTGTVAVKFFSDSRVILNDGKGTDTLQNVQNAVFDLTLPAPLGPEVSSETHPDQTRWYKISSLLLRWTNSNPVQGYSFHLDREPVSIPDDISEGIKNLTTYTGLEQGTHYFHIKALRSGVWGGITHFAANVDTESPAKFSIEISPSSYTTSKNSVIRFQTTDAHSGLSRYEYKVIKISGAADAQAKEQDFFIEAEPPLVLSMDYGTYDIIARAIDVAGNYREEIKRLKIVPPLIYAFTSPVAIIFIILTLILAGWGAYHARKKHLGVSGGIRPEVRQKLEELKRYQSKYGKIAILFILLGSALFTHESARAQEIELSPPFVTTVSKNISNDEIFYVGGKTDSSGIDVVIYLQNLRTGATLNRTVTSDKKGDWFYRHDAFLESGTYLLWAQARLGELSSPPGPQIQLAVNATAIQFGASRLSFETLYLAFIALLIAAVATLVFYMLYHLREERRKKAAAIKELREAKDSIQHGFALLKKDIEAELKIIKTVRMEKGLRQEEREKERQLLEDLAVVEEHIAKEVGDMEMLEYS